MKIRLKMGDWRELWLGGLMILCLALVGCGKDAAKLDENAFDEAAPEIKVLWDRAKAADQANEYAAAVASYKQLTRQEAQLTPEQVMLLRTEFSNLQKRVIDAAREGNPAARQLQSTMTLP